MKIVYDPAKNRINIAKHGISLADTEAVFHDPCAIVQEDHDHEEARFVAVATPDMSWLSSMRTGEAIRFASFRQGRHRRMNAKPMKKDEYHEK
jgi:uncharacterized DUF497 family protein